VLNAFPSWRGERFYAACGEDEGDGFLVSLRASTRQELSELQDSLSADLERLELTECASLEAANGVLSLILSGAEGNSTAVTEADYENARRMEQVLQRHRERLISPPRANGECVCPEYYPELWGLSARAPFRR